MKYKKTNTFLQFSFIAFLIIIVLAGLLSIQKKYPNRVKAFGVFTSFGGQISSVKDCTCTGSKLIKVDGDSFMYMPGASTKYKAGAISNNDNAVGTAIKGAEVTCLVGFPPACEPENETGTLIRVIGTS